MKNVFSPESVFTDETLNYRTPEAPMPYEPVRIFIRTAKNGVDAVYFCTKNREIRMKNVPEMSTERFDFYDTLFDLKSSTVLYYFKLIYNDKEYFYYRTGISFSKRSDFYFSVIPGYSTPKWAKGAVMYQIFVDRFCNGDTSNDVLDNEYIYIGENAHRVIGWNTYPKEMDVRQFYGGDLEGVRKKLGYLKKLGVEVLYLNPIFVSPSNHKYDIEDYDYVDPHYGVIVEEQGETLKPSERSNRKAFRYKSRVANKKNLEAGNAYFAKFVAQVHEMGMKIILDGVFNHCGSFNKWLDREGIYEDSAEFPVGAYKSYSSPYHSYFRFTKNTAADWPDNVTYEGWWGVDTLPKLNYEGSKDLFNYIMHIAAKWVSPPYNVDGWRLDVAADLGHSQEFNHFFWKEFRKSVMKANPNAIILAEHYGDPSSWLKGDEWDSVMNYDGFMEPVTWFLTGMDKHSDEYKESMLSNEDAFFGAMKQYIGRFSAQSLDISMNELSNHDHSRFLTRTNMVVGRTATKGPKAAEMGISVAVMRAAVVIQMTWVGAPTVYYGDEAGVCGWTDPDNRRTYPWGNENIDLLRFHYEAIKIHKAYDVLKTGSIKALYGTHGVVCYGRFDKNDQFVILVNNNNYDVSVEIPVWQIGIENSSRMVRMLYTNSETYGVDMAVYYVENGMLNMRLWSKSAVVVKNYPKSLA